MSEKIKKDKSNLTKKQFFLIFLTFSFHLLGIISSLLRAKREVPFHFPFHFLRFFSWWSVHASILATLAVILIWREGKTTSSYFTQFLILIATIYNLVTFGFILTHFLIGALKSYGFYLDLQLFTWHFVAPLLTIFYFYFYARIDKLRKKLVKTLLFALISPVFYFFYAFALAKINDGPTSSLFPYMEKYPYSIFEWIVEGRGYWVIINFLIASFVFISLYSLMIWTKNLWNKKRSKK
jgi:hypothetical protein